MGAEGADQARGVPSASDIGGRAALSTLKAPTSSLVSVSFPTDSLGGVNSACMYGRGRGSNSNSQALLRSALTHRLGERIEVRHVIHGENDLVLVLVHLPDDLPVEELLRLKGWMQAELEALSAEQSDGVVIVPAYD